MTQQERTRQIDILLERFDFNKVHTVMDALDWTWCGQGVPSIKQLKTTAQGLLENLSDASEYLSTGGFKAYWATKKQLGLEFTVEYQEIDKEDI